MALLPLSEIVIVPAVSDQVKFVEVDALKTLLVVDRTKVQFPVLVTALVAELLVLKFPQVIEFPLSTKVPLP